MQNMTHEKSPKKTQLLEGEDYIWENGLMVFTREYHLKRGHCCKSGCRFCPYGFSGQDETPDKRRSHGKKEGGDGR